MDVFEFASVLGFSSIALSLASLVAFVRKAVLDRRAFKADTKRRAQQASFRF